MALVAVVGLTAHGCANTGSNVRAYVEAIAGRDFEKAAVNTCEDSRRAAPELRVEVEAYLDDNQISGIETGSLVLFRGTSAEAVYQLRASVDGSRSIIRFELPLESTFPCPQIGEPFGALVSSRSIGS